MLDLSLYGVIGGQQKSYEANTKWGHTLVLSKNFLPSVRTAFEIMETPQQTYSQNIEYLHVNLSCFQSIEINVLMSLERIPIRIFHFFWILYPETAQMVPRYGIWFQNLSIRVGIRAYLKSTIPRKVSYAQNSAAIINGVSPSLSKKIILKWSTP